MCGYVGMISCPLRAREWMPNLQLDHYLPSRSVPQDKANIILAHCCCISTDLRRRSSFQRPHRLQGQLTRNMQHTASMWSSVCPSSVSCFVTPALCLFCLSFLPSLRLLLFSCSLLSSSPPSYLSFLHCPPLASPLPLPLSSYAADVVLPDYCHI